MKTPFVYQIFCKLATSCAYVFHKSQQFDVYRVIVTWKLTSQYSAILSLMEPHLRKFPSCSLSSVYQVILYGTSQHFSTKGRCSFHPRNESQGCQNVTRGEKNNGTTHFQLINVSILRVSVPWAFILWPHFMSHLFRLL